MRLNKVIAWLITILAVIVGWVFFRATSFEGATTLLTGMFGLSGFEVPNAILVRLGGIGDALLSIGIESSSGGASNMLNAILWIILGGFTVLVMPNVQQLFSKYEPSLFEDKSLLKISTLPTLISWKANGIWAFLIAFILLAGTMTLGQISDFLYFQF